LLTLTFRTLSVWTPTLGPFLRLANHNIITFRPGYRAFDEQQVFGLAHLDNFQVLGGAPHLAHVAGHAHAAHDGAGEQALTDGARAPMPTLGAVGGVTSGKTMAFYNAFEAAALGHSDGVHEIAFREESRPDHISGLNFLRKIPEFLDKMSLVVIAALISELRQIYSVGGKEKLIA
jgi:hypothetical protein